MPRDRENPQCWPEIRKAFQERFALKTRAAWESIFDGTDACCTPVLSQQELEETGYRQRPAVVMRSTPALAITQAAGKDQIYEGQGIGVPGEGWAGDTLDAGSGGEETLVNWTGWKRGQEFDNHNGALIKIHAASKL